MTDKIAPALEGQIRSPNPIELFWEKNRKSVIAVGVIAALATAGYYGLQYMRQRSTDDRWSQLAAATGLDRGYTEEGSLAAIFKSQQQNKEVWFNYYLRATQNELVSDVLADLKAVGLPEIEQRLAAARGQDTEPLILWAAANRAREERDWDACERYLDELEKKFPKHFLCAETDYPVQYREEKESEKPVKDEKKTADKKDKPELLPPVRGSETRMLRAHVTREKEFRAQHVRLYIAPEPDPSPTVVLKLTGNDYQGEVKIRFYRAAAPKHVDNFLQKCKDGFFNGQRIHMVQRQGADGAADSAPHQIQFGLPGSKDDDRTKWVAADDASKLDFEESPISHFPGMVAAASAAEGKSSAEQIWINANDCAQFVDGDRVVFGRVVEGLELIAEITQGTFETEDMRRSGQGRPAGSITIESTTVVE